MMHHLILGYGYCGYYLARELLNNNQKVTALSRHLNPVHQLSGLNHITHDLNHFIRWENPETTIYYLIPPSQEGEEDQLLKRILENSLIKAKKIIYFGSSGVYGNHKGAWVTEESKCLVNTPRQLRRLNAEQQWLTYSEQHQIEPLLLRIAGIYGPQRIPIDAAQDKTPIIYREHAPYTNYIFVKDLARIALMLSQKQTPFDIYNIADGEPQPMGTLQQLTAQITGLEQAPYESWEQALERASPMKREFMNSSKRLIINRIKTTLGPSLQLTLMREAIYQSI